MKTSLGRKIFAALLLLAAVAPVGAASLDADLLNIQQTWARINYSTEQCRAIPSARRALAGIKAYASAAV